MTGSEVYNAMAREKPPGQPVVAKPFSSSTGDGYTPAKLLITYLDIDAPAAALAELQILDGLLESILEHANEYAEGGGFSLLSSGLLPWRRCCSF
eukprot:IDg22623t1